MLQKCFRLTHTYVLFDFCRFPSDPHEFESWKTILQEHNSKYESAKKPRWQYRPSHRVCLRHFSPDCLIVLNKKIYLKPNSIPTIFKETKRNDQTLDKLRNLVSMLSNDHQRILDTISSVNYTTDVHKLVGAFRQHVLKLTSDIDSLYQRGSKACEYRL